MVRRVRVVVLRVPETRLVRLLAEVAVAAVPLPPLDRLA